MYSYYSLVADQSTYWESYPSYRYLLCEYCVEFQIHFVLASTSCTPSDLPPKILMMVPRIYLNFAQMRCSCFLSFVHIGRLSVLLGLKCIGLFRHTFGIPMNSDPNGLMLVQPSGWLQLFALYNANTKLQKDFSSGLNLDLHFKIGHVRKGTMPAFFRFDGVLDNSHNVFVIGRLFRKSAE